MLISKGGVGNQREQTIQNYFKKYKQLSGILIFVYLHTPFLLAILQLFSTCFVTEVAICEIEFEYILRLS